MRRLNLFSREMTYECTLPISLEAFLTKHKIALSRINERYFYIHKVISAEKVYLRKLGKPGDSAIIIITAYQHSVHIKSVVDRRAIYSFGLLMIVWLLLPWIFEEEFLPMFYVVLGLSFLYVLILISAVWQDFNSIQVTLERLFKKENISFEK